MESSFSAILIEAAMKLASLTDANLFILVETKDGRRFAGKPHLCDMYTLGKLAPVGTDLEMEVDPSVIGLRARYVSDRNSPSAASSPTVSFVDNPNATPNSACSQPPSVTSPFAPSPSNVSPRSRNFVQIVRVGAKRNSQGHDLNDLKRRKLEDLGLHQNDSDSVKMEFLERLASGSPTRIDASEDIVVNRGGGPPPPMTSAGSQTDFFLEKQPFIDPFGMGQQLLGNDDGLKTLLHNQEGSQFQESRAVTALTTNVSFVGSVVTDVNRIDSRPDNRAAQQLQHLQHQNQQQHHQQQQKSRKPYPDVYGWDSIKFLNNSKRAKTLSAIQDASIIDKTSANHKLFTSLIHEYMKESINFVPEDKVAKKEFIDKIFFNFWLYFPHLETLHNSGFKINIGKRGYFLKAFVRAGIARGLSSLLGRRFAQQEAANTENHHLSIPSENHHQAITYPHDNFPSNADDSNFAGQQTEAPDSAYLDHQGFDSDKFIAAKNLF